MYNQVCTYLRNAKSAAHEDSGIKASIKSRARQRSKLITKFVLEGRRHRAER